MMDIDHFKQINDAFGHAQGDMVLSEITDVIKNNVRKSDIVARYGGEEFVALLPNTDEEGAFVQAERLREAVKGYRCSGRDRCIMVTISLGFQPSRLQRYLLPMTWWVRQMMHCIGRREAEGTGR